MKCFTATIYISIISEAGIFASNFLRCAFCGRKQVFN